MAKSYAISATNLVKHYGKNRILDEISIHVEKGVIYGLLGASGCGKTTLLSSILGTKKVESGEISLLGYKVDKNQTDLPRHQIGYMPQEIALIQEFTIDDIINYFGRIHQMSTEEIKNRSEELEKLLELPPKTRYMRECSGGQQRRVSFAIALLHKPEVLILDEPTVGLDPLLREKIWNYLKDLVKSDNITVIITTHYIDECKEADRIGLMRGGKLLAENSPSELLSQFHTSSLEEVFLELSKAQEEHKQVDTGVETSTSENKFGLQTVSAATSVESCVQDYGSKNELTVPDTKKTTTKKRVESSSTLALDKNRMRALLNKNWKQFYRNIGGVLFLISFPIIQLCFFVNSVGVNPKNLNFAVVNEETSLEFCDGNWNSSVYIDSDGECHLNHVSCTLLDSFNDPMMHKVYYETVSDGIDDVKHGKAVGVLHIPQNFSEAFEQRITLGQQADIWTLTYGEVKVHLDMSNRQIAVLLQQQLYKSFSKFLDNLLIQCNVSTKLAEFPFKTKFYYGSNDDDLTIFMAPGMVVMMTFLLGCTMTSQILIKERSDGIWDRSIIAGVSSLEITMAHLLFQASVMLIQSAESIFTLFILLQIQFVGNIATMYLISFIAGVCGMAYGFFGSSVCKSQTEGNLFCTGGYMILLLLCGVIWPIEGMPTFLEVIAKCVPCTISIQSFRNVMAKGWSLWDLYVIRGVAVDFSWIVVFAVLSVWVIKSKK